MTKKELLQENEDLREKGLEVYIPYKETHYFGNGYHGPTYLKSKKEFFTKDKILEILEQLKEKDKEIKYLKSKVEYWEQEAQFYKEIVERKTEELT